MADKPNRAAFDLCHKTWKRITDRYGETAKATDFSPTERTVVLVWTVFGIVENGGFDYLFSSDLPGDPGYQLAVEAFRTIGCEDAVRTLEDALAVFPAGKVPEDKDERKALFKAHSEEERDRLTSRLYRSELEIEARLADYIRKNGLVGPGH